MGFYYIHIHKHWYAPYVGLRVAQIPIVGHCVDTTINLLFLYGILTYFVLCLFNKIMALLHVGYCVCIL